MERKNRCDLIADITVEKGYQILCEIGVSTGNTFKGIKVALRKRRYSFKFIYGIDPGDTGRYKLNKENIMFPEAWYLKMTSDEATSQFGDNYLDLVFVDGDHNPEQIKKDILNYSQKVKSGGCIVVDDQNDFTGSGIKAVVNEIIGIENLNLQLDERLESGKDNWLGWTFITKDNGVIKYSK